MHVSWQSLLLLLLNCSSFHHRAGGSDLTSQELPSLYNSNTNNNNNTVNNIDDNNDRNNSNNNNEDRSSNNNSSRSRHVENTRNSPPQLAPWWDLRVGAYDVVRIDCAAQTDRSAFDPRTSDTLARWRDEANQDIISMGNGSSTGPYVLKDLPSGNLYTLVLKNLTAAHSGRYSCVMDETGVEQSIVVSVNNNSCSFETSTCGWQSKGRDPTFLFQLMPITKLMPTKYGPSFDATYSLSRRDGGVMNLNLQNGPANGIARLMSPVLTAVLGNYCIHMWLFIAGPIGKQSSVDVNLISLSNGGVDATRRLVTISESILNVWEFHQISIVNMYEDFQVELVVQKEYGKNHATSVSLDNFHLETGLCKRDEIHKLEDGKIRLRGDTGQLDFLLNAQWKSYCGSKIKDSEAVVICRLLGKSSSLFTPSTSKSSVWFTNFFCPTKATQLIECHFSGQSTESSQDICKHDSPIDCHSKDCKGLAWKGCNITHGGKQEFAGGDKEMDSEQDEEHNSDIICDRTDKENTQKIKKLTKKAPSNELPSGREISSQFDDHKTVEEGYNERRKLVDHHAGIALGITLFFLLGIVLIAVFMYRKRKSKCKNSYVTFSNPRYQFPANDVSLDSPLSPGTSILDNTSFSLASSNVIA